MNQVSNGNNYIYMSGKILAFANEFTLIIWERERKRKREGEKMKMRDEKVNLTVEIVNYKTFPVTL